MTGPRLDLDALNGRLGERMEELARHLAGEPTQRERGAVRFRGKGSLAVVVAGPKRGAWHDHEADCGGDPLGLVAHLLRQPMREAFRWALDWLGEAGRDRDPSAPLPCPEPPREAPDRGAGRALACDIWRAAEPVTGTLAEAYLAARGLVPDPAAPLRFHPACPRGRAERLPAMLALMTDPATGEPAGLHRTFLALDGSGKAQPGPNGEPAKMMLGGAGVVRLTPDAEVTEGLGIAEGIETALSVMQGFGWRPVWAAASAGGIRRFPVLPGIGALTVFADPDGPGLDAARACCARWAEARREARLLRPPAGDFNDLTRKAA